jgi:hypothetical protein
MNIVHNTEHRSHVNHPFCPLAQQNAVDRQPLVGAVEKSHDLAVRIDFLPQRFRASDQSAIFQSLQAAGGYAE